MLNGVEKLKVELEEGQTKLMKNVEASINDGSVDGARDKTELAIKISEELKNVERLLKLAQNVDEMQKKRKEAITRRDKNKQKIDEEEKDLKVKLEELKKGPNSQKKKLESDREKLVQDIKTLVKDAKPEEAFQKVSEAAKIIDKLQGMADNSSENELEIQKIENKLIELSTKRAEMDKKFEKKEIELIMNLFPPVN